MNYSDIKRDKNGCFRIGPISQIPDISQSQTTDPYAVFLGPHAENQELLTQLITQALQHIYDYRAGYFKTDPEVITSVIKSTPQFRKASKQMQQAFSQLLDYLLANATPYFSLRYQGHMLWDNTLPAIAGYFASMLHNPNNVSFQASTSTTPLAMLVGWDLCHLVGFEFNSEIEPWSHLTADGTIANIESLWAARELRSLPFALREFLNTNNEDSYKFKAAKNIVVKTCDQNEVALSQATTWQLLNLTVDEILRLPKQIARMCEFEDEFRVWDILVRRTQNATGWYASNNKRPIILVSSTRHYSWPKAAAITGYGFESMVNVFVDADARLKLDELQTYLEQSLQNQIPVVMVVAVCGSTEESAVDDISAILALRESYRQRGMDFLVHVDAAWGGYMLSTIRKDYKLQTIDERQNPAPDPFIQDTCNVPASDFVIRQLKKLRYCDALTIDPHKWGYVQYPAGAVLYRNGEIRRLTTFNSAYIGKSGSIKSEDPSVGIFGVEGSRAGASAAAVYMSHRCLRPTVSGYGKIISECLFNTRKFYARLLSLNTQELNFIVVPLPRLPAEKLGNNIKQQLEYIQENILAKTGEEIQADSEAMELFRQLGPDQNILDYAFNVRHSNGSINKDVNVYNQLNELVYEKFSMHFDGREHRVEIPFMVTMTTFHRHEYGDEFMDAFSQRLGLANHPQQLHCLRSVIMDPYVTHTADGSYFVEIINLIREQVSAIIRENLS